jgi:hypothetical protein
VGATVGVGVGATVGANAGATVGANAGANVGMGVDSKVGANAGAKVGANAGARLENGAGARLENDAGVGTNTVLIFTDCLFPEVSSKTVKVSVGALIILSTSLIIPPQLIVFLDAINNPIPL